MAIIKTTACSPHATWKVIIIEVIIIQGLNVELVKILYMIRITLVMKLTLNGTYLYVKPTTVLFLFEFKQCVEHVFYIELSQYTVLVRNSIFCVIFKTKLY